MCSPTLAVAAIGAGLSGYGMFQNARAQKDAANAIAQQNRETMAAQNEGFTSRLAATAAQTEAQKAAYQATLGNERDIANAMRARQQGAFQQQQSILDTANKAQEGFRGAGYANADALMGQTSGANLGQAQTDWQNQGASLLDANMPAFAQTGGTGDDPYVNQSLARRAAEAAANIRGYGAKTAKLGSYGAPFNTIGNAITESQTGIMPADMASKLLSSSAPVLLAPAETAWTNAGRYGEAAIGAAQQSGQMAQNIANLQYQNSTDLANLKQSDRDVTAANISEQAQADAKFKAAMGNVISGIGNLGLQGAGFYGKLPSWLPNPYAKIA